VRLLIKLGDEGEESSAEELGSSLEGLTLDNISDDPGLMR
jgi:hypothetical protein